jgi:hypothetical protein
MVKTLGDYIGEGGVIGRAFVDEVYSNEGPTVYTVENTILLGRGSERSMVTIEGKTEKGEVYIKAINLCFDHKESEQTSPKCTEEKTIRYCLESECNLYSPNDPIEGKCIYKGDLVCAGAECQYGFPRIEQTPPKDKVTLDDVRNVD